MSRQLSQNPEGQCPSLHVQSRGLGSLGSSVGVGVAVAAVDDAGDIDGVEVGSVAAVLEGAGEGEGEGDDGGGRGEGSPPQSGLIWISAQFQNSCS